MKLAALVVVAFLLAVTGDARAGGGVDWSEYLDDGSKLPVSKSPQIAATPAAADDDEPAAPAKATKRTAKAAKAKKGKKTSKAKAAKAKTRAKTKKRR